MQDRHSQRAEPRAYGLICLVPSEWALSKCSAIPRRRASCSFKYTWLKITFWTPFKNLLQRGEKRISMFLFFFFNGLKGLCHLPASGIELDAWKTFSRDQRDMCIDNMQVVFCVLSFSKCQWLFRITDNAGLLQHLHGYARNHSVLQISRKIPLMPQGTKENANMAILIIYLFGTWLNWCL